MRGRLVRCTRCGRVGTRQQIRPLTLTGDGYYVLGPGGPGGMCHECRVDELHKLHEKVKREDE